MKSGIIIAALLASLPTVASASIIQADFRSELSFPTFGFPEPRVLEANDRAVAAGTELTANDQTSNPYNWNNALEVDLDGDILTLTPDGANTYQVITISLTDLVFDVAGQALQSVTLLSNGAADNADLSFDWTASSLNIEFVTHGGIDVWDVLILNRDGFTQFQLNFGPSEVPEPAALGLLGAGLIGIAALRRRKA